MGTFPVKVLIDENNEEFIPWVSADGIHTNDGLSFEEKFATKIDASNLKEGTGITIIKDGADCTFNVDFGASDNIIDNLDTTVAGLGSLDARQGNVLKDMIPQIADNLETTDASKVLSANQGYELSKRSVPEGGLAGQVLKKSSDDNHELEWGDAADPNAIVGDGSIMKIIELTYAEYKTLESNGELQDDTEYHVNDMDTIPGIGTKASQVEMADGTDVESNIKALQEFDTQVSTYFEEEFDPRLTAAEENIGQIREIDQGQNTRLDVAEGNIDTIAGTVNTLSERISNINVNSVTGDLTVSGTINANNYQGKWHDYEWHFGTENTTDTWIPVVNGKRIEHRVLDTALSDGNIFPRAGSLDSCTSYDQVKAGEPLYFSGLYTLAVDDWHNLINIRHRNGSGDGINYGMQIRKRLTSFSTPIQVRGQSGGNWSSWETMPRYQVLYDNASGTNGTITLSDSAANYEMLEIHFRENTSIYNSCRIVNPHGKVASLISIQDSTDYTYYMNIKVSHGTINGTTIAKNIGREVNINNAGGISSVGTSDMIYITKVIGWR